jgi:hypothetical protein
MPHFGLVDDTLQQEEASLLRARLHVRGVRIRLSEGRKEDGVAALYDAMLSAMLTFFDSKESRTKLQIDNEVDFNDDRALFIILQKSGIIHPSISLEDFDYLYQKMDEAIEEELTDFDEEQLISGFERIMTNLEVIPFDERELPEGEPVTL